MAEVAHLLGSARLLTLTGREDGQDTSGVAGGRRPARRLAQGVYFVPLAPVSDPALVVATVAQALGLREAGDQPLQEILLGYLRDKELLLVLDNFEQVVAAAPLVGTLLARRPPPEGAGDQPHGAARVWRAGVCRAAARLPALRHLPAIDALTQYEAVALFIQRAQLAKADFAVTDENAPRWRRSVCGWMGCPWPSNWPPRASSCCPPRRCWRGWRAGSRC